MAAQPVRNIAPFINVVFTVTSKWWEIRWEKLHRGLDIATGGNDPLYSMLDGRVLNKGFTITAGNYIIIVCDVVGHQYYGYATRYLHMKEPSPFNVGDRVVTGQQVGIEGRTGQGVTGIHLHLEMQDVSRFNWQWHVSNTKSDYLDPTVFMGIDNVEGTKWYYNGTPVPPVPPVPTITEKKRFPWVLYARKLRSQ